MAAMLAETWSNRWCITSTRRGEIFLVMFSCSCCAITQYLLAFKIRVIKDYKDLMTIHSLHFLATPDCNRSLLRAWKGFSSLLLITVPQSLAWYLTFGSFSNKNSLNENVVSCTENEIIFRYRFSSSPIINSSVLNKLLIKLIIKFFFFFFNLVSRFLSLSQLPIVQSMEPIMNEDLVLVSWINLFFISLSNNPML